MSKHTSTPIRTVDESRTGCVASTSGMHAIDWAVVPAMTWNAGLSDERVGYGSHRRGFCWNCDERFVEG